MNCSKIISYTVPMFGNTHTVPYGIMEVLHYGRHYVVKFGKLDAEGFNYVTIGRKQYRFRNVGSLYSPKFEFLDSKAGKPCAKQTMAISIPESADVEYDPIQSKVNLIVPVGTDVPMTIKKGTPEGTAEPFEAGVLACQKDNIWQDCDSAEVYIGIFTGTSEADVIAKAAAQEGCSESSIRLIPLKESDKQETEFDYLCGFAKEADFECEALPAEQLRALWTAYCFHTNLDIDTFECDTALRKVWEVLKDKESCCWDNFDEFDHYMADGLC